MARTPYYCARQEGDGAQYKFIDWIVTLPVDLEKKLVCEINESEEEKAMPIVTNAEKFVKLEMAIGLYEDGVDHEIIKRRTGYSVKEIKEAIKRRNQLMKEAA